MKKIIFLSLFLLIGCGREGMDPSISTDPVVVAPLSPDIHKPSEEKPRAIILAFGAQWCSPCHSLIPQIEQELNKLSAKQRAGIEFRVYAVTGRTSSDVATQADADFFVKKDLKINAIPVADPRWATFKKVVSKSLAIPGGAVLDGDGKLLKSFPPGEQFNPREIVSFAASR